MWLVIGGTILLMLPAGMANMAPVLFQWLPFLNTPVDFNKQWGGRPIFGANKTYRGFFVGIICSIFTVWVLSLFSDRLAQISPVDFGAINIFYLGALLGGGALAGDLLKSFFKRRLGIASGKSWVPLDQLDWIFGALIFAGFYINIGWIYWLTALVIFGLIHPLVNLIGYWLKIKPNRF
ncbi:MAG: CDP-archaeol synthase [Patescibacteria group bacterium]|nr:CDP-archaeol synthase [Patescibacteria group bacterium]